MAAQVLNKEGRFQNAAASPSHLALRQPEPQGHCSKERARRHTSWFVIGTYLFSHPPRPPPPPPVCLHPRADGDCDGQGRVGSSGGGHLALAKQRRLGLVVGHPAPCAGRVVSGVPAPCRMPYQA